MQEKRQMMRKMRLFYEAWQPVFEPQTESTFAVMPVGDQIELFDFRSQVANELCTMCVIYLFFSMPTWTKGTSKE